MIKDYRPKPDWFERHAGLGGWVGGIGAIIAIFAAWYLAHAEYTRDLPLNFHPAAIRASAVDTLFGAV